MKTRKITKPTATTVVEIVLTLVVLAASITAGVWTLAAVFPAVGPVPAAVIAFLAAVGVEAIVSTFADEAVKSVGLRHQNREAVR